jgi:hypothetical protein
MDQYILYTKKYFSNLSKDLDIIIIIFIKKKKKFEINYLKF